MAENTISTSVKEVTFDDVIAEFDREVTVQPTPSFNKEMKESVEFEKTPEQIKKEEDEEEEKKKAETEKAAAEAAEAAKTATGTTTTPVAETKEEKKVKIEDVDSVLDRDDEEEEEEVVVSAPSDNSSFISGLEALVEEGQLYLFDEDKPLNEYTPEDIKELLKANIDHHKTEALENEIGEFFESLPKELQYAAKYVADGGTDLKNLFKALAATEEIKSLDVSTPTGREAVITEYYRAIDWGTDEEIEEELERLRENGDSELEKVAKKFKPKLEKMQEEVTRQHIARQEKNKQLQEQEMNMYLENAQEAIKSGKLGNIQLDKKTQISLWAGITQPTHQTRRGAPTNELGHLLEKYQYIEPNFEKIYKALWLLRDEEGFEEHIARKVSNQQASQTVRVLRTEESKKTATGKQPKEESKPTGIKKIKRNNNPSFLGGLK